MTKVKSPWDEIEGVGPEQRKRLATVAFAIDDEESEVYRATFNTASGQRCLDLLHRRYIDQPRFDPNEKNPVYAAFSAEGRADVVRIMEAKARPTEQGD